MSRRAAARIAALALLAVAACATDNTLPVPGTTTRVEEPTANSQGVAQLDVRIFSGADDCYGLIEDPAERAACLPYVDRATGQVRMSFQVRAEGRNFPVPLSLEQVDVFHKNQQVQPGERNRLQLVPHGPRRSPQLFVLVIDSSGSMNLVDEEGGPTRMEKVRRALLRRDVVNAFFPPEGSEGRVRTAVVPLVFAGSGQPQPLGGQWLVEDADAYRALIRDNLRPGAGYTFLYQAVQYGVTTLLDKPEIKQAVAAANMQPTVIALTDGFNNEAGTDTCGDNAARLTELLRRLATVRREAAAGAQPAVYTVGLGRPVWKTRPGAKPPPTDPVEVTPQVLCRSLADERIDGGVERLGVDNEALARISRVAGGDSYIRRDTDGLAEAFKAAAAMRYEWFELRYQVDPFYLRRAFASRIRLANLFGMEAEMRIHPSGWLDGPPGVVDEEGWAQPAPFRYSIRLLLPVLAGLIALSYLPAVLYNARRPFRGRVTRRRGVVPPPPGA